MLFCIILSIANKVQESQLFFQLAYLFHFIFLKTPLDKQRLAAFVMCPIRTIAQRVRSATPARRFITARIFAAFCISLSGGIYACIQKDLFSFLVHLIHKLNTVIIQCSVYRICQPFRNRFILRFKRNPYNGGCDDRM